MSDLNKRRSGILLHITSLPSQYGIGDFGPEAYKFADFLTKTKQSIWQILPLSPIEPAMGNSPYNSSSAFAGNKYIISPDLLIKDGLLSQEDIEQKPTFAPNKVEYRKIIKYKTGLLNKVYDNFKNKVEDDKFEMFCSENTQWLEDFALFTACKKHFNNKIWNAWPIEVRDRAPESIEKLKNELENNIEKEKFFQYLFFKQWYLLKQYCNNLNIQIIGDMPIYVDHDSADVWSKSEFFNLDGNKNPAYVSGVPPDYFSKTGQLWGNPVYRWDILKNDGYSWWLQRMEHNLKMYDLVRLDHFRGFVQYWEVAVSEKNAMNGRWVNGPGEELFHAMAQRFPNLPIIAEDLGIITPDVIELKEKFCLPGLKVLLFAFSEDFSTNPYAPHNHVKNCLVYTGTHDNNTVRGWFETKATAEEKTRLGKYLGEEMTLDNVNWKMITLAMKSVANTVIIPMQDLLGLGSEARMNTPSKKTGNWEWQMRSSELSPSLVKNLKELTKIYGRVSL